MSRDFLNDLNSDQQKAVMATAGPTIILAGAGSGKTRVITYKILYLIKCGVDPLNILAVTFTNKTASEMKDRVRKFIKNSHLPTIATFHSLCAKILRIEGKNIGLSLRFVIYDEQDQLDTVKEAMKKLDISTRDFKPHSILATISEAKNELITENEYPALAVGHFQKVVSQTFPVYQKLLAQNDALDFDDLLMKTVELFAKNPSILKKYQNKFNYILVDEYQDTNHAQYMLTKLLAGVRQNVCVVGDFSQSIYSWRGADFRNLEKFRIDFSTAKTFSLSQNYRSTQKILDAASAVISRNTTHPVLKLWTNNQQGEDVTIYEAGNEQDEANYITSQISEIITHDSRLNYSDFAVLYRTNAQSRAIEEVFLHQGVPYILVGGTRFYERKEIKDVLAYLRLLANPKDMVSYKRVEKLGKERLAKFLTFQDRVTAIRTIELLDQVVAATEYLSLYDEKDEEDRQRLENIKELRSVALEFPGLTQFLENVALVEQENLPDHPTNNGEDKDVVTLMTLHGAKGLEFPFVFIVGMEEGLFPHSRSLFSRNELEEERRLCYVGMTRAKQKLFLTFARRRLFFGQRSNNTVSRFIFELPQSVLSQYVNLLNQQDSEVPEFL